MKRSLLTFAIRLVLFLAAASIASGQNNDVSKSSNPLVGTWKSLGPVDSNEKVNEAFQGQTTYETILEDGTFFALGFRKNFPKTGKNPTTLDEYNEIGENVFGQIAKYTLDTENNKIHVKYTHNIRPASIGNEFTANFKVVGDTAFYWFDKGKRIHRWLRISSDQNMIESTSSKPLIGTWMTLGAIDSTGKAVDFFKGQTAYSTFLEDGTHFGLGFRASFPQTGKNPSTLEEYEEIAKNIWGRMSTYTVDSEKKKSTMKNSYNFSPQGIGNEMTSNYEIVGDTLSVWFDRGKNRFQYLKVK